MTSTFKPKQTDNGAILVINCGSSSVKFSLIQPATGNTLLSGLAECLLTDDARIKIKVEENKEVIALSSPFDHQVALDALVEALKQRNLVTDIIAVGHRVVHGGEHYAEPALIDEDVEQTIAQLAQLAPLHNPANLIGIKACQTAFANLPQVAIFDTAFHQTMPEKAYLYGFTL